MQMEGLYTFSSQQLQEMIRRPSSTDNPPSIRKRIITSSFSKKQSLLSQASTREGAPTSSNDKKSFTIKKVAFLMDCHLLQEEATSSQQSHLLKTRSLGEQNLKNEYKDNICERKTSIRYPLVDLEGQNEDNQSEKKTLSTEDKIASEETTNKKEEISNNTAGTVREKRIFSLRLSPKIVPISDRRLPKVFKIKNITNTISKQTKLAAELQKKRDYVKQDYQQVQKDTLKKHQREQQMVLRQSKKFKTLFTPEL